ncbi:MAG: RNase inhibitor [Micrococcaceae bacterium]|jgi:O-acetyl-ADP-ribose deacetylase (regulator of RNase III)|nr:RNase inhibitor [Micrococcaceae bacterium]
MDISIIEGDITVREVDAIVNAANSTLLGGGGVDGAIHRAAGPQLLAACREVRKTVLPGGLPAGDAIATGGFDLPARWVIHTVGPNRGAGQLDEALLVSCFARSLIVAEELHAASVAFPAVGAGAYGWPADRVADAASKAVQRHVRHMPSGSVQRLEFVLARPAVADAFRDVFVSRQETH